jgi:hypothetical protein
MQSAKTAGTQRLTRLNCGIFRTIRYKAMSLDGLFARLGPQDLPGLPRIRARSAKRLG